MPVSATAWAMAVGATFAASCETSSRRASTSARSSWIPGSVFRRRSRIATSLAQSIPSTRNAVSVCVAQTSQVRLVDEAAMMSGSARGHGFGQRGHGRFLHVAQRLGEQVLDVMVVQCVEDHAAAAARPYDAEAAEE